MPDPPPIHLSPHVARCDGYAPAPERVGCTSCSRLLASRPDQPRMLRPPLIIPHQCPYHLPIEDPL